MKEKLTVSDSKKLFHEQFPYVIPGLYKRIVDEMLVELNLLTHQNEFFQDDLFCVGLTETFKELMEGYKPEKHLDPLFMSLCNATNFEGEVIRETSQKFLKEIKNKSSNDISNFLIKKNSSGLYSSRLLNLGIYTILCKSLDFHDSSESDKNKLISEVLSNLNLSVSKADKDIGIYKSSLTKLKQARELIEEFKIKDKKKTK